MKLIWTPATTLSLLQAVQTVSRGGPLKDDGLAASLREPVAKMVDRLASATVRPSQFWDGLTEEVLNGDGDGPLTAATIEIAILRGGGSQLQSDQTAMFVHRQWEICRRVLAAKSPRMADQLKLRYAPLKQAYEAYGPGLIRAVGRRIWNGPPPPGWWPDVARVYAVTPLRQGGGDVSESQTSLWIEAVLTDIDPAVPEWLRLVYLLTVSAVREHTRSHSSGAGLSGAGSSPSPELPWALGVIPLVLAEASDLGALPSVPHSGTPNSGTSNSGTLAASGLPIDEAVRLWVGRSADSPLAAVLETWWSEIARGSAGVPPTLKQLAILLAAATEHSSF